MKKTKKSNKGAGIENYTPPDNVVKIQPGDTGFNLVKKNYNRFIWTWNDYNKKNKK